MINYFEITLWHRVEYLHINWMFLNEKLAALMCHFCKQESTTTFFLLPKWNRENAINNSICVQFYSRLCSAKASRTDVRHLKFFRLKILVSKVLRAWGMAALWFTNCALIITKQVPVNFILLSCFLSPPATLSILKFLLV